MSNNNEVARSTGNSVVSKVLLITSALVFLFYLTAYELLSNVYQYAFVGALFEFLSIPMLLLLIVVPVLCIVQLIIFKGRKKWHALASLMLIAIAIYILWKS
jgi:hypothetical protein